MSDTSTRTVLANLYTTLQRAFGSNIALDDDAVRELVQEVTRAAKLLEGDPAAARKTRGRHGPAESAKAVEPPTFPGHKKRL